MISRARAWAYVCQGEAGAVAVCRLWQIVVVGIVLVFTILGLGGRFEKAVNRCWPWRPTQLAEKPPDTTHLPSAEETNSSTHR